MKSMRKRNKIFIFVILLLCISIGFAYVNGLLKLNGTANISRQTWDIYFDNIQVTAGSVTPVSAATVVAGDPTKITYSVILDVPGDYYEFTVDAVNNGSIDAMISNIYFENTVIKQSSNDETEIIPEHIKYSITYADGVPLGENHLLAKKNGNTPTVETYKVRIEFRNDIDIAVLNAIEETDLTLKFEVVYEQADETAIPKPVWVLPNGRTKDNLQVGDEICAKGECFNFIKYDGNDVVMLAKYNLKVGNIYSSSNTKTGEYTSNDPGYGKQSSEARGWVIEGETKYGTVAFSATNYWDDNGTPKSDYPGSYNPGSYPTIYDSVNYKTEPDFSTTCDSTHCFNTPGYSVAYYVDAYKTLLTNNGTIIKNARLLTYDEATDSSIGCSGDSHICPPNGFITNTTFWLGSARKPLDVWTVDHDGNFYGSGFYDVFFVGVRPVIVVEKSNL